MLIQNIANAQGGAGEKATWENISLLRKHAITPSAHPAPGFSVSLGGSLPLGGSPPQSVSLTSLQAAAFTPGTMEQLFERFQEEFFIGDPSSQSAQNFEMQGTTNVMPGFGLGLRFGNRFEIRANGHYFHSKWSGTFPVTVFPNQQEPSHLPQTVQGNLSASSAGVLADAGLACFLTNGTVRPFVHAGIRGQIPTRNESGATLAGVVLPLETIPTRSSYSPFGGAGVQAGFMKNGFVEGNVTYANAPGGGFAPVAMLSIGWTFGRNNPAMPLDINAEASGPKVHKCGNLGWTYNEDEIWAKDKEEAIKKAKEEMAKKHKCPDNCPETYTPAPIEPEPFTVKTMGEKVHKSRETKPGQLEYRWIVNFTMLCDGNPPE